MNTLKRSINLHARINNRCYMPIPINKFAVIQYNVMFEKTCEVLNKVESSEEK